MLEQGGELGTENQFAIEFGVQQRFFSDSIARQKQGLCALVPDRKSKHAAQMFGTVGAVLVPGMNDRFRVAVGIKLMAELLELIAQFAVVVNLAVEDNPGSAVLIMNWLLATFQVNDREPAH